MSKMKWAYKDEKPYEVRLAEASKIREKHPERVPVIVEKVSGARIADLDRKKYLVPGDLTVAQFMHVLRQRIQLGATESIYVMVDGITPTTSSTMATVYDQHKDDDGFIYMAYSGENSMGCS
ncbi:PREDICTED: gamma-aminobutyric acid receptor-associated protein-like 2 [Amphimedon queenslandica]|uniref:Autophagy-related protein n=1 Tax=Amphimedon queenslandica TaxID=400682 RepID=A0A1X7VEM4_AMPQE|nr:PREDICTED: gamma-aminobutyric acid receptor-associated protein-like 2 [Amphimedon queenslandica]|eukprot:XP_003384393.1 PREDICTED: gamma-aminobutyric acid receptor-associated protein-like 2 [Amphimedon queenslandica]